MIQTNVSSTAGGFIKTVIRVLRCVGHYNSKLLIDKVLEGHPHTTDCSLGFSIQFHMLASAAAVAVVDNATLVV